MPWWWSCRFPFANACCRVHCEESGPQIRMGCQKAGSLWHLGSNRPYTVAARPGSEFRDRVEAEVLKARLDLSYPADIWPSQRSEVYVLKSQCRRSEG